MRKLREALQSAGQHCEDSGCELRTLKAETVAHILVTVDMWLTEIRADSPANLTFDDILSLVGAFDCEIIIDAEAEVVEAT